MHSRRYVVFAAADSCLRVFPRQRQSPMLLCKSAQGSATCCWQALLRHPTSRLHAFGGHGAPCELCGL